MNVRIFRDLACCSGRIDSNPIGGDGIDDFISWVAAGRSNLP